MIRGSLAPIAAQKAAQGQRIGHPPGDASLRAQALEVADQEHAEIDPGRDARPAQGRRVMGGALLFHEPVKPMVRQQLIQLRVERTPRRLRQLVGLDPHLLLPTLGPSTHRRSELPLESHGVTNSRKATIPKQATKLSFCDFFNGLLVILEGGAKPRPRPAAIFGACPEGGNHARAPHPRHDHPGRAGPLGPRRPPAHPGAGLRPHRRAAPRPAAGHRQPRPLGDRPPRLVPVPVGAAPRRRPGPGARRRGRPLRLDRHRPRPALGPAAAVAGTGPWPTCGRSSTAPRSFWGPRPTTR